MDADHLVLRFLQPQIIMNAFQLWVTDNFLKKRDVDQGHRDGEQSVSDHPQRLMEACQTYYEERNQKNLWNEIVGTFSVKTK